MRDLTDKKLRKGASYYSWEDNCSKCGRPMFFQSLVTNEEYTLRQLNNVHTCNVCRRGTYKSRPKPRKEVIRRSSFYSSFEELVNQNRMLTTLLNLRFISRAIRNLQLNRQHGRNS